MSLCMMIAQPGTAHLIVDGGIYDKDGVCIGIGRKVGLFPSLSLAIGSTGYGGHPEWIEEAVARKGGLSQQSVIRSLPSILDDLVERHGSRADGMAMKLHVIAADAAPASACFVISSDAENMPPGYRPFSIMRVRGWIDFADPSAVLERPVQLDDPESFNVVDDGRLLAQAARLDPWDRGGQPSYHVAGFADIYSVGPQGLQHRRLCEWPEDHVGEPTNPFKQAA